MRCCGSQTTFTAREVAVQFETLLFKEAFAPLAKALGFSGDAVVAAVVQSMTRGAGAGLSGPLETAIESAAREDVTR
jgi:hypothetical protein